MANSTKGARAFDAINKSALTLDQASAGAGVTGLLGFVALFAVTAIFFVTEFYFIAMFTISLALLIYITGADVGKLVMSAFTIFFSSKHLTSRAAQLQATLLTIKETLEFKRDAGGEISVGPLEQGQVINLPDSPLTRDIKTVIDNERGVEYAEYVAHSYYVECHELYDQTGGHFEFVSGAMPLFGLIGTILGLITMFDSLGGDVTVEALSPQLALALKTTLYGAIFSSIYKVIGSRFDQRLKALDYEFDTFVQALQVIIGSKAQVEVKR